MFITVGIHAVFNTWYELMFMICIPTEFHFPSSTGTVGVASTLLVTFSFLPTPNLHLFPFQQTNNCHKQKIT